MRPNLQIPLKTESNVEKGVGQFMSEIHKSVWVSTDRRSIRNRKPNLPIDPAYFCFLMRDKRKAHKNSELFRLTGDKITYNQIINDLKTALKSTNGIPTTLT